jgi:molybdopterin-guanine dinucleotide biosynthesis protein A
MTTLLNDCPVLGICGRSGADRAALTEALLLRLRGLGLRVAAVKDDAALSGGLTAFLASLCAAYDVALVEGNAAIDVPKIWLAGPEDCGGPPQELKGQLLAVLRQGEAGAEERLFVLAQELIAEKWRQTPVWGCVLIGGRSSRMGRPKHLLPQEGKTWLERAVETLSPLTEQVVISGSGLIPDALAGLPRVPDVPGLAGPLAGILAVMRWQPAVSWLVMACDLPDAQPESLRWLLEQRRPGIRAVLPDLDAGGRLEPLLAWYDFRCRTLLEEIAASGPFRLHRLAEQAGICRAQPPAALRGSWRNVNTPEELLKNTPLICPPAAPEADPPLFFR